MTKTIPDISQYQRKSILGKINFSQMKLAGASGTIVRGGYGLWVDRDFYQNFAGSAEVGPRGIYWYMDWYSSAISQAAEFCELLAKYPPEFPPVVDYECRFGGVPSSESAKSALVDFLNYVEKATGRVPIIYTSPGYWWEYGSSFSLWRRYPLWLAHYEPKPIVPKPWVKYDLWQYTSTGNGRLYGIIDGLGIDLSQCTDESFARLTQHGDMPQPPEPDKPRFCVTARPRLMVRAAPYLQSPILDRLDTGAQVTEYERVNGWIRIDPIRQMWCSLTWLRLVV